MLPSRREACAALEGAHADLLRRYLAEPLAAYGNRTSGLIDDLLREQSFCISSSNSSVEKYALRQRVLLRLAWRAQLDGVGRQRWLRCRVA